MVLDLGSSAGLRLRK